MNSICFNRRMGKKFLLTLTHLLVIEVVLVRSYTRPVIPQNGRLTLIPGQTLNLQCETIDQPDTQYLW